MLSYLDGGKHIYLCFSVFSLNPILWLFYSYICFAIVDATYNCIPVTAAWDLCVYAYLYLYSGFPRRLKEMKFCFPPERKYSLEVPWKRFEHWPPNKENMLISF